MAEGVGSCTFKEPKGQSHESIAEEGKRPCEAVDEIEAQQQYESI
jgi:hypothetical protein